MANFGMVGKFKTDKQNREALVAILTDAAALMQDIDDCHLYTVATDADHDDTVWVMELWESREAHDHSLTLPAVRALIEQAMPLLTAQPDGATLVPVSDKRL